MYVKRYFQNPNDENSQGIESILISIIDSEIDKIIQDAYDNAKVNSTTSSIGEDVA
ncbi:hypothetical protein [Alkalibacillus salilacus]|uniref:Uncharacterized protein n=1 Tax=Alkalibacillus salilacus TaxID=284582 RepID=A0ABT9VFR1_9BACI|nr:hypothetical protein [Alkalibacillus salilacus]MDQ0159739.1 hypothetical protein [Alkalibacillus salilacus]